MFFWPCVLNFGLFNKINPMKSLVLRIYLTALALLLMAVTVLAQGREYPEMFAHRGCWSAVTPENSVEAVRMAKRFGYKGIECDVHYTKDKRMVILHDATLNRTARLKDGYRELDKPVRLSDLTFEELRRDYVLASPDPRLRTPIPTLEELLVACKEEGIVPMLHSNLIESYRVAQQMFGHQWIAFTDDEKVLLEARTFSDCAILLAINSGTAEENIARLERIGGRCGVSTMNYRLLTAPFCQSLAKAGYIVQASIFPQGKEDIGQRNGISFQLTDFSWMPRKGQKPFRKANLLKGASLSPESPAVCRLDETLASGALVVDLVFEGEVEVELNDGVKYTLQSEGGRTAHSIGRRFIETRPQVKITPKDGAVVARCKARFYRF